MSAFNLTGTKTRLSYDETVTRVQQCYAFHEEASLKVQGIKGSTSQTQGPDGTLSATTLHSVKMILEGLSRLKTKVVELNSNFIQHVDVESLLTLFVENFFSSMRGGNTDTPMMLDFCLRFPRCINKLLKRVTGTSYRYFTNPVASYYLQPTLGDVDINFCDLAKLPKPSSGCLTKKQLNELRQWTQQYGRSVRQNTTRNFSTKDKPGTLPLSLYESAPPEQHSVDFDVLLNEDIPAQQDTSTTHNVVITQSTYVVVSRMYKPHSAPNSPLYITKLLEDVVDDRDSAGYVRTLCHTQDVVDPLLFTTSGEEHVIPKEAIKGVVSNITVVDNETIEIDEEEYYLLLALLNGSTDTTSCNEADEEPFAENYFEEQGDEDSMTSDVGRPQRKRKRAVNNEFLFY